MGSISGRILITGGAGFLGRGIMRRAALEGWDAQFTVYSRDEQKQDYARRKFPDARFVLGDICDFERLELVAQGHDTLIHTAAIKYIPEGEFNAAECVRINVDGSRSVLAAARSADVGQVIAISTDKAVLPINIYGASKMVMERLVSEMADRDKSERRYTLCRYGNVVGSTGSVIPVFKRQLRESGIITITDPDMTRFWISIDDAVDLIVRAAEEDVENGAIVIPQPKAMRLYDLASAVILEAFPHDAADSHIKVVGKRAGEKMHEDLISEAERARTFRLGGDYYELLPVWQRFVSALSPAPVPRLTSAEPSSWMGLDEMLDLIQDASEV